MTKKEKTSNAAQILRNRYVKGDAQRMASVEAERVNAQVARMIYDLRTEAGLIQKELAEMVGTTQSVISRLEDADYEGHSLSMLSRIAQALEHKVSVAMTPIRPRSKGAVGDIRRIKQMEDRLDEDYRACFPSSAGWERAALHLLLAYDFCARAQRSQVVDKLKYALMHVLRWGCGAPSRPITRYPRRLDTELFESSRDALRRGSDYTGICGAFISYHRQIVEVERLEDAEIDFTANAEWKAYDVLDEQVAADSRQTHQRLVHELSHISTDLANQLLADRFSGQETWFPDFSSARRLIGPINGLLAPSFVLPRTWEFDGIPILQLRHFWRAIAILAWIHGAVAHLLTGTVQTGFVQLIIRRREDLASWISKAVRLEESVVLRLLDLHTYDRCHRLPDIALTPFLPIGKGLLAASPWMLLSSAMERNFCAFAARQHKDLYDATDSCLAPAMGEQVAAEFAQAGFKTTHPVSFRSGEKARDMDLLVWSPEERYVLAVELKWIIGAADFMEVLNRGEDRCKKSMEEQLPAYSAALSTDAAGITQRAFNLDRAPVIDDWSCGLLIRGFVGTPRLQSEDFCFLPEELVVGRLRAGCSMRELCEWAKARPYVPVENRDFRMCPIEVTSPSGIAVRFWEWEVIDGEGKDRICPAAELV